MGALVLAGLIAAGLGLMSGGYYSAVGWIIVGGLLLATMIVATVAAGAPFFLALAWTVLAVVAFNAGLGLSLVIRNSAEAQRV